MNRFPNPARMLAGIRTDAYALTAGASEAPFVSGDASRVAVTLSLRRGITIIDGEMVSLSAVDGSRLITIASATKHSPTVYVSVADVGHLIICPLVVTRVGNDTACDVVTVAITNPEA